MQHLILTLLGTVPANLPAPQPSIVPSPPTPAASATALYGAWSPPAALASEAAEDAGRDGWYATLFAGYGLLDDGDFEATSGGVTTTGEGSYDGGFSGGFAVGYRFRERWSVEFEQTYRTNDIDSISLGGSSFATGGDYASLAYMANLRRDFGDGPIRPFVGLGLGVVQEIDVDIEDTSTEAEGDFDFAWQLSAGAAWDLNERWSVSAEARYFSTAGEDLKVDGTGQTLGGDYDHLGFYLGATYSF